MPPLFCSSSISVPLYMSLRVSLCLLPDRLMGLYVNGQSYELLIWPELSQCPSEQKPIKILEKGEREHIQGSTAHFWAPLLSRERVKLQTSNFVRTFTGSIGTKPIKNIGKSSRGRSQGHRKIFRAHIMGASRGQLCDSSAFLVYIYPPGST